MSTRAELVARWQDQLAVSESLLDTGSNRLRWLWHMRARLYRFLLSCYGEGAWEPAEEVERDEDALRAAPLVDNRASLGGLQPRSADRIRATLESVKVAIDREEPPGPTLHGLAKHDWIRVAAYRHGFQCNRLLLTFAVADIDAQSWRQGKWFVVEVRRVDYDAALQVARDIRRQSRSLRSEKATSRPVTRWQSYCASLLMVGLMVLVLMVGFIVFGRISSSDPAWDNFEMSPLNWLLLGGIVVSMVVSVWTIEKLVWSMFISRRFAITDTPPEP